MEKNKDVMDVLGVQKEDEQPSTASGVVGSILFWLLCLGCIGFVFMCCSGSEILRKCVGIIVIAPYVACGLLWILSELLPPRFLRLSPFAFLGIALLVLPAVEKSGGGMDVLMLLPLFAVASLLGLFTPELKSRAKG